MSPFGKLDKGSFGIAAKIAQFLLRNPGSNARQIAAGIASDKTTVNRILYKASDRFEQRDEKSPPQWYLIAGRDMEPEITYAQLGEGVGMLQHLGYKVGHSGMAAYQREEKLSRVMERPLPPIHDAEYMERWGEPLSKIRLGMLIRSLEAFKNTKSSKSYNQAVSEWQSDVEFLAEKYGYLLDE